jgi:hypothetical protein
LPQPGERNCFHGGFYQPSPTSLISMIRPVILPG